MKKTNIYADPVELVECIKDYHKTGRMSEKLGGMILDIAKNYSTKGSFRDYTWVDDMVGEAVLTCVKYIKRFNPEVSNKAFSYITTICHHSFLQYIKKQKKHGDIKDVCFNKSGFATSVGEDEYGEECLVGINYEPLKPIQIKKKDK